MQPKRVPDTIKAAPSSPGAAPINYPLKNIFNFFFFKFFLRSLWQAARFPPAVGSEAGKRGGAEVRKERRKDFFIF